MTCSYLSAKISLSLRKMNRVNQPRTDKRQTKQDSRQMALYKLRKNQNRLSVLAMKFALSFLLLCILAHKNKVLGQSEDDFNEEEIQCAKENNITLTELEEYLEMSEKQLGDSLPIMKAYLTCLYKNTSMVDDQGIFNKTLIIEIYEEHVIDLAKTVEFCLKNNTGTTLEDKIFNLHMCIGLYADYSEEEIQCANENELGIQLVDELSTASKKEVEEYLPRMKKYTFCVYKKLELVDKDGKFNEENLVKEYASGGDSFVNVIKECLKDVKPNDSLEDKVWNLNLCFRDLWS